MHGRQKTRIPSAPHDGEKNTQNYNTKTGSPDKRSMLRIGNVLKRGKHIMQMCPYLFKKKCKGQHHHAYIAVPLSFVLISTNGTAKEKYFKI